MSRRLTGEEIMEETKKQAVKAWGKILPFGAQVVASAAAYSVGITATQVGPIGCASVFWCSPTLCQQAAVNQRSATRCRHNLLPGAHPGLLFPTHAAAEQQAVAVLGRVPRFVMCCAFSIHTV